MSYTDRILSQPLGIRRVLALLLIPILAVILWGAVVIPLRWIATSQDEWREETRRTLSQARGQARTIKTLQLQVNELPKAPVWQQFYALKGTDAGASAVQQDVISLGTAAGLENPSMTELPAGSSGRLIKYSLRFTARGSADRLQVFLARLREQPRYLRVERLHVTSPQSQAPEQNPLLTVSMDIAGFGALMPAAGDKRT